jgi:hypothetical protein
MRKSKNIQILWSLNTHQIVTLELLKMVYSLEEEKNLRNIFKNSKRHLCALESHKGVKITIPYLTLSLMANIMIINECMLNLMTFFIRYVLW